MIYFIQAGDDGPVKIGYARTRFGVGQRIAAFQTAHAQELVLRGIVPGDREDERTLHEAFASDRMRGEWFRPSEYLLSIARDQPSVVWLLDDVQSWERWRRMGMVTVHGVLTAEGREVLKSFERRILLDGWDLAGWYENQREPELRKAA